MAIIVTTDLVSSHPALDMLNETLNSNGINNNNPTIITANHDQETNVSMMFHVLHTTTEETVVQFQ